MRSISTTASFAGALSKILAAHPSLTSNGYMSPLREGWAEFRKRDASDPVFLRECLRAATVLRRARSRSRTYCLSYGAKHAVERARSSAGLGRDGAYYVSNGALIAVALMLGVKVKKQYWRGVLSINPRLGFTYGDLEDADLSGIQPGEV